METGTASDTKTNGTFQGSIFKYKFHYFIVIPAMLYILAGKLLPFIMGLKLPFIKFNLTKGIAGSTFTGMQNFSELFSNTAFMKAIKNSIILNAGAVLLCSVLALIIIYGLSRVESKKIIGVFTTIFLTPLFIPSIVYSYWIFILLYKSNAYSNPEIIRIAYIIAQTIKYGGIPIIIGAALVKSNNAEVASRSSLIISFLKVILAFAIIQFSSILTNDYEMISSLYNPSTYTTMDTVDTYAFRSGFTEMQYGVFSAAYFLKYIIQLITTVIAYMLVKKYYVGYLFLNVNKVGEEYNLNTNKRTLTGYIPAVIYAGVVLFVIFEIIIYPFLPKGAEYEAYSSIKHIVTTNAFVKHFLRSLAAVIINLFIIISLAYPLTVRKLPGRSFYKAILLGIMCIGGYSVTEYMFYKNMGMVNTSIPFIINGSLNIAAVFVIKSIFNSKYTLDREAAEASGKGQARIFFTLFIPRIWRQAVALGILQFSIAWSSFYYSLIFTRNREDFTPIMIFREIMHVLNEKIPNNAAIYMNVDVMKLGALITIVPILLFLLCNRLFTAETFVGQLKK